MNQKFDLSLGQKELWFIHSMKGQAQCAYNESVVISLKSKLSIRALAQACELLMCKHDALKTSFHQDNDGNLYQQVQDNVVCDLTIRDDLALDVADDLLVAEISRCFNLSQAPLFRILLINLAHESRLVLIAHHIIIDGISFGILMNDLSEFYNQYTNNRSTSLLKSTVSYFDHIKLEKESVKSEAYQNNVQALTTSLKDFSGLNFLTTPTSQAKDIFSGDRVYFKIDSHLYSEIRAFVKENRLTPFHLILATYCVFLSRYTRTKDVLVGVPFANRTHASFREVVGYFTNLLPLRFDLSGTIAFKDLLAQVKSLSFLGLCRQNVAFEHIASNLQLTRKQPGIHPLIQTILVWGGLDKLNLCFDGVDSNIVEGYFPKASKFDLSIFLFEEKNHCITGYFEYRDGIFDRPLIQSFANSFVKLIKDVVCRPNAILTEFNMLDDEKKSYMKQHFFKANLTEQVTGSLYDLFACTVQRYPNNIGLVCDNKEYSYQSIAAESHRVSSYINNKYQENYDAQLPQNTLIAVCTDRNEDMIFALLGILQSGAAYVPIDPKYPKDRINYILEHSRASLVLTHKKHKTLLSDYDPALIIYLDDQAIEDDPPCKACFRDTVPQDMAYVLYTSGSTGRPKGVAVSHENVICLFESLKKQIDLSSKDVLSLFHTFCFDISVWEIWGALLFGGKLIIVPYEVANDSRRFYQLVKNEKVTVLTQTPSAFQLFLNEDLMSNRPLEDLRYITFVGESLKVSILRSWVEKYGTKKPCLMNMYGITETTVFTNYKVIKQGDIDRGRDNIGFPLEQFSMCILDEDLTWCPEGFVGEICIGGRGLSRGYLFQDSLTNEKFIQDPYASFLDLPQSTLLYQTGDLGRWLPDGSIEYLGRKDFQVKLRGFRIELGEIEAAIGSFPEVAHITVVLKGEGDGAYLAAYFTVTLGCDVKIDMLETYLIALLPEYMIPKKYTILDSMPMTINGKINREELISLKDQIAIDGDQFVALETSIEKEISAIWSDILKIDINKIGSQSNFFKLGGNSLLVIKMLAQVSQLTKYKLTLNTFVTVPTIKSLLKSMTSAVEPSYAYSANQLLVLLEKHVKLSAAIKPLTTINKNMYEPKVIFLTGATGYLGAHLLSELLKQTEAKIYCLVRSDSTQLALAKLTKSLKKYKLEDGSHVFERIHIVLGDLSKERFLLSETDFLLLAKEVDAIYHVGAQVNHVFDYHALYQPNVASVNRIIELAVQSKNKAIFFISTLAALSISPMEKLNDFNTPPSQRGLNSNGYLLSKWVCEKLLYAASEKGVAAHVFRPGNIIAGNHGVYEPDSNHTLLRLKGMLQLGCGYAQQHEVVEMMPVDLLSKAIVDIAKQPKLFSYNMHNKLAIFWTEYLKIVKNYGYHLDLIDDHGQWSVLLKSLDEDNAFFKLGFLYQNLGKDDGQSMPAIGVDHQVITPSYQEMITLQLDALTKVGFLDLPNKRHKQATEACD